MPHILFLIHDVYHRRGFDEGSESGTREEAEIQMGLLDWMQVTQGQSFNPLLPIRVTTA